ncbi:MAG: ectonucleotide pyrophosphatase/phosphodiesterase [Cyclobacteriaceae bacterium]
MIRLLLPFLLAVSLLLRGQTPYVLLVSFDGFRHDYVERFQLPNFQAFIREGAAADGLIPSFPSKTFPNHYSIVTGLYPGNHGLVDNQFYDPDRGEMYGGRWRSTVEDPYYYGGTPLWKLARQHELKSASYFWVGSELAVDGEHPDYYYLYNDSIEFEQQIDQVITWLRLPAAERPHFITLYFSSPDHESHEFGPVAPETQKTLQRMDSLLGLLMQGVRSTRLPVNVILVSDHGMKEMKLQSETFIFLDELMQLNHPGVRFANGGTQVHLYTSNPQQRDSLFQHLNRQEKHFTVMKREEFPERWHYDHPRSGELLMVVEPGFYFRDRNRSRFVASMPKQEHFGAHGFDPATNEDMRGIFYAQGPNVKSGSRLPAFQNIHIYPLIARMLKMKTPSIDGDEKVLGSIFQE